MYGWLVLLRRCLGRPGEASWPPVVGEPVAAVHAAVCPAGHPGSGPVVVVDLSAVHDAPMGLNWGGDGRCPACPDEWLLPAEQTPLAAIQSAGRCRCCLATWWPGTGWWGCPDTGRLISVAGPVSEQAFVCPGPQTSRIRARALAGFLLSGGRPAAHALAREPFGVCVLEHADRRYVVVTNQAARVKAVLKVSRAGTLRRLDWLRASAGPAVSGLLGTPSHLR